MANVSYLQYEGVFAHLQPERILTDPSSRSGGILLVPFASSRYSMSGISDSRHRDMTAEVLEASMGPPTQEDSNIIKLKEAGITLAMRVFHPKEF